MNQQAEAAPLAQRARQVLDEQGDVSCLSSLEEELRIHSIELELQNDELTQSRARLEESQTEYRRLFEYAPTGYLVVDQSGYIQKANTVARELFGGDSLLNERWERYVQVQHLGEMHRLLGASPNMPLVGELDLTSNRREGSTWFGRVRTRRLEIEPALVLVSIENITETKQALQRAVDSETSFRRVIEATPDAIAVVQLGDVVLANSALLELFGIGEGTALGTSLLQYVQPEERVELGKAMQATMQRGSRSYLQLHLAAGKRAVEMRFATVRYNGSPSVLVIARDITERLRVASETEHNSRLASLGMLVAGVAHEVNNPLTFLIPNLNEALERLSSPSEGAWLSRVAQDELRELIREAKVGADRVAAIVKDLKVFHSVKECMERVDLNQIVVDTLNMAVPKLEGIVVVSRDLGALPEIVGNSGRLGQVILNLLLNASQAIPDGNERSDNKIDIRTCRIGEMVQLIVQDNGRGISEADQKLLFDPFFSKRKGGTGLGLTVCASLVREMGGWIEVDSQIGRGTRFVLRFPIAAQDAAPQPPISHARPRREYGLKLLVVDDEPLIFRTIRRALGENFTLTHAISGQDAIKRLEEGLDVDAVLTDLVMPCGTGLELFEWASNHCPELSKRFVFMSGMAHPESIGQLPERPQLQKPFSMAELETELSRVVPMSERDGGSVG